MQLDVGARSLPFVGLYPDLPPEREFGLRQDKPQWLENQEIGIAPDHAFVALGEALLQAGEPRQVAGDNALRSDPVDEIAI